MSTCPRCENPLEDIEHTCEPTPRTAGDDWPASLNDTAQIIAGLSRKLDALSEHIGALTVQVSNLRVELEGDRIRRLGNG